MDRNRWIAVGLISLGFIMLFGRWFGFFTIVALLLMFAGVLQIRQGYVKKGYILLGVGAVLLLLEHLMLIIGISLISLGIFYGKSKRAHTTTKYVQKQNFMSNFDWDRTPWVMRSLSVWHVLGEADVDLSLALPEERQTVLMFHGMLGDIDLMIPDYYGVEIEASILFGSIHMDDRKETGILNRVRYKSPNYETSEYKVKFIVSYLGGDLNIRMT
ncbi:cell wall-active antibiotics response protein LiaF [Paenibacillus sp. ISL-20]|uniref:cell wall-active antibiotics response protein LiaF n=1 Tax=Paenibacillus sp. ISL-20 TaxID=2819163 RepID=UPI001BEAC5CF|nr:cell wall-active antibiotics response protein LiaF [Paenibacillus sp. ISL-20]MBT2761949.1 cell wall-active antibiotics response protein [Paenibacillus sp. ISL-20]